MIHYQLRARASIDRCARGHAQGTNGLRLMNPQPWLPVLCLRRHFIVSSRCPASSICPCEAADNQEDFYHEHEDGEGTGYYEGL